MNDIFDSRRQAWYTQNLKYLRYVFNDHFVLVLLIGIGYLAVQYMTLLRHWPADSVWGYPLALSVSLLALAIGRLSTFIEAADQQFLLVKTPQIVNYFQGVACLRSMILPSVVLGMVTLAVGPLIRLTMWQMLLWWVCLLGLKYVLLRQQGQRLFPDGQIDWQYAIQSEAKRQSQWLVVFSQFTQVKGLPISAKRRRYLDVFVGQAKATYPYLVKRLFLRSGDFFGLWMRLLALSVLMVFVIDRPTIGLIIGIVLQVLMAIQMFALDKLLDQLLMTKFYPQSQVTRRNALVEFVTRLYAVSAGLVGVTTILVHGWSPLAFIIGGGVGVIGAFYVRSKGKTRSSLWTVQDFAKPR